MIRPMVLNVNVKDINGNNNIVAQVIDMHFSKINRLINGHNNNTLILTNINDILDIQLPFQEVYNIYKEQTFIDDRYKEDVDMYLGDNYFAFKKHLNNNGETS